MSSSTSDSNAIEYVRQSIEVPISNAAGRLRQTIEAFSAPNVNVVMAAFPGWFEIALDTVAAVVIDAISEDVLQPLDENDIPAIFFNAIVHPLFENIFTNIEALQILHLAQPTVDVVDCYHFSTIQGHILSNISRWESSVPHLTDAMSHVAVKPLSPRLARYMCGLLETIQTPGYQDILDETEMAWHLLVPMKAVQRAVRRISLARGTFMSAEDFKDCVMTGEWACLRDDAI